MRRPEHTTSSRGEPDEAHNRLATLESAVRASSSEGAIDRSIDRPDRPPRATTTAGHHLVKHGDVARARDVGDLLEPQPIGPEGEVAHFFTGCPL